VSNVFATRFGFHIVKVLERKPAGPASLEEVQEHIRERLSGEARNDAVGRFLDGLREKATVEEVA
jgi:peptidyl-prolyl cis-trans isomerase C